MAQGYAELRAASAYSFLQAASLPEDLAAAAAAAGVGSMALADSDGVYGIPRFAKACRTEGIRPLCGARVTTEIEIPGNSGRKVRASLLLLCRNTSGWGNLCELITASRAGRSKDDPVTDLSTLERLHDGLVCLGGGMDGPVLAAAAAAGKNAGAAVAARLMSIFGAESFCLDLQRHDSPFEEKALRYLTDIAAENKLKTVISNDVRYASADRSRVLDVLLAIRNHKTLDQAGSVLPANHRRFIRRPDEMAGLFADLPGIVERTGELAESLEFNPGESGYRFPDYPTPVGITRHEMLRTMVYEGVRRRYRTVTDAVERQIEHELRLIGKLELSGYFLLVDDISRFCRENGILAQGRGSAANSAVCYALGITAVDPISMGLLFERFLSEERGEWPDIDIDLPSGDEREKVIQYVYARYGARHVGMTSVVVTYRGRNSVREVGRVLGLDQDRIARLSRLMRHYDFRDDDESLPAKLKEVGLDADDMRVSHFIDMWHDIQDLPRHVGQHVGGMVISGTRLDRVVPIEPARMPGRNIIQWDKDDIADMKLIKVDLLGLGMLAAISQTMELVEKHEGRKIDLAALPQNDPAVYDMLCQADTIGVFQVESRAQMATLPRMKPTCFYDLVVEVAIIRPGPIVGRMLNPYLERRAGRRKVVYAAPCLEPILKRTLGVPLFQEQLMKMAMEAAGFSGGEAEELRRAMGSRRSKTKMQKLVGRLHEGMERRGISRPAQDEIVNSIVSFALYGFPESHAASFALIAYASAWLKAHHHAAFTTAILNCWPMGFYSPSTLVGDAARHGVEVRPIDVNHSEWECSLQNGAGDSPAIRLGLKYIKGLSEKTGRRIVDARETCGQFQNIIDVGERALVSREELILLAESGAAPDPSRRGRRDALWQAMSFDAGTRLLHGTGNREYQDTGTDPLFEWTDAGAYGNMISDFRTSGLTTGPHPMAFYRESLDAAGVTTCVGISRMKDGSRASVAGMVIVRQRPPTAKGMYFATLEDETGHAAIAVRPDVFVPNKALLSGVPFLIFSGVIQNRDGVASLLADRFRAIDGPFDSAGRNFH